jgi:hypothetical protein
MSQLITAFKRLWTNLFQQNQFKIQSFTYFIPAPKPRKTGYREKQFDKLFFEFINVGYNILDFKTQRCMSGQETSGIWVIFILQAKNAEAEKLNLDKFGLLDLENQNDDVISHSHPEVNITKLPETGEPALELPELNEEIGDTVQGLYQIKDK